MKYVKTKCDNIFFLINFILFWKCMFLELLDMFEKRVLGLKRLAICIKKVRLTTTHLNLLYLNGYVARVSPSG